MPEEDKNLVTPEEQNAEKEYTKEVSEDELRESLSTDLGLDPEEDGDILDKLVEREKSQREKLSTAIKQKINWRTKAQATSDKPGEEKPDPGDNSNIGELVAQKVAETLEERDLASLKVSDTIKDKIKTLSKLEGITIKEASNNEIIKEMIARDKATEDIVNSSTGKKSGSAKTRIDANNPPDPDNYNFDTEDGRKAWEKDKAQYAKLVSPQ